MSSGSLSSEFQQSTEKFQNSHILHCFLKLKLLENYYELVKNKEIFIRTIRSREHQFILHYELERINWVLLLKINECFIWKRSFKWSFKSFNLTWMKNMKVLLTLNCSVFHKRQGNKIFNFVYWPWNFCEL